MGFYEGMIREVRSGRDGARTVWISCLPAAIPNAGQYLMAWSPEDHNAPLATPLYLAESAQDGFLAAPPLPVAWEPGTRLELQGPNGRGFQLLASTRRLALAALGDTTTRLMPLITLALQQDIAISFYSKAPAVHLPAAVEIITKEELGRAVLWADLLMIDLTPDDLGQLRKLLDLQPEDRLPCPAQALVSTQIICGGLADCGACFVPGRRGWKKACQDGPVFDLTELAW